jgi:polar amino acid transport system substrate-binding protein
MGFLSRQHSFYRGLRYLSCLLLIYLGSCSSSQKVYTIGVDPSWFPLDFMNKEPYVLAFTSELLQKIAQEKHCYLKRATVAWDELLNSLQTHQCQAVCASLEPQVFNLEKYSFSHNFLDTGPVLVALANASDMGMFYEKEIGVFSQAEEQLLMQRYPGAVLRMYDALSNAFLDLVAGNIDALAVEYLQAFTYINDLYSGQCKIVSSPLNQAGLKLVCLAKEQAQLIKLFNEGIKELKKNGVYEELLKKWKLGK